MIREGGFDVEDVSAITKGARFSILQTNIPDLLLAPEMLSGRVKTLHPAVRSE